MSENGSITWPVPGQFPALGSREIHLWCGWLDRTGGEAPADGGWLSPDETTRARAFHFEVDRNRYVAARLNLRCLLACYLERDPATLVFNYNRFGKPTLAHQAATSSPQPPVENDLTFNQAHSGPLWLLAVARHRPVGVDLEEVKDLADLALIEDRIFAPHELARQQALPPEGRRLEFFRRWTQREAAAKFHGVGLDLGAKQTIPDPSQIEPLAPARGYVASIAYGGAPARLRQFRWDATTLSGSSDADRVLPSATLPFSPHRQSSPSPVCSV